MFGEILLALWTAAGGAWWVVAWRLVDAECRRAPEEVGEVSGPLEGLTVFKPLPPLGAAGIALFEQGLDSFAGQLDASSEMIIGIHEADRAGTAAFLERLRTRHPRAAIEVVYRSEPDSVANPKIAWQRILAGRANGGWWLWSDADIIAPTNFLGRARAEFSESGARLLTFPYVMRRIGSAAATLDALFVNAEFYPGVLLLRDRGRVDFGLGAGLLFRRDDFLASVGWMELGAELADDFALGQRLAPVAISRTTLETAEATSGWRAALGHYLRWNKTIRWNRPLGYAARLLVLPLAGWLVVLRMHADEWWAWAGFILVMQIEVLAACAICRRVGCRGGFGFLLAVEVWSLWRVMAWVAGWLPIPVVWRGRWWWAPRRRAAPRA